MSKNVRINSIAKYAIIVGVFICLAVIMVLSLNVIPVNRNSASAAGPTYKGYYANDTELHFKIDASRYITENYLDPNTGETSARSYYKVPFINGAAKWNDVILPDTSIRMDFQYFNQDNQVISNPFDIPLRLSAGASNTIYAYPTDFNITGTTWYGESYSGSASSLTVAGVYNINAITLSYHVGNMNSTHLDLVNREEDPMTGTPSAPYAAGSITLSSNVNIVVTADIFLDDSQSEIMGLNKNLNLTKAATTYSGSAVNFRNIVKLHSTESSADNSYFTYSTKKSSYNIGNIDTKYFKQFSNKISGSVYVPHNYGLGLYTEQSDNLESNTYPNTTLIGISSRLNIQWNKGAMTGEYGNILSLTEIPNSTSITMAGVYYLRIIPTSGLISGFQPVTVKLNSTGKEYIQTLEIYKKQISLDLVGASFDQYEKEGLVVKTEKEYDKTASAVGLFGNKTLTSQEWQNIGGIASDFVTLKNIIESKLLFDFVGSVFDSAEIGNKSVSMYITMYRVLFNDNTYGPWENLSNVLAQYEPIPGRMVSGNFTPYNSALNPSGYKYFSLVGIPFKITEPGLSLTFNTSEFSGSFTYGQYLNASEFVYQRYADGKYYNSLDVTNTTPNPLNGKISVDSFENWQIAFVSKVSDMKTDASKNIIYVMPMVGKKLIPETTKVFVDSSGQEYYAYSGRLYAGSDYYFYYAIYVYFSTGNNTILTQQSDSSFFIPKEFGSQDSVLKLTTGPLLNLNIQKREVLLTVNQCVTNKAYDGTKNIVAFGASATNIITSDAVMIELGYSAQYSTAGVGNGVAIDTSYFLKAKPGYEDQDLSDVMNSYDINTLDFTNNSGVADITKGNITPLTLNIKFVRTNYTRKFNDPLYVVVRVAKAGDKKFSGETLAEDLFYFYTGTVDEPYRGLADFCKEGELTSLGINNYVVVEISGFMAGEGFLWDNTNTTLRSFMTNMTLSEPVDSILNSSLLLSWYDSIKGVEINKLTDSSKNAEDTYRLEFSDGENIAPNYVFDPIAPALAYLYIEKLTPAPDVIVVEGENESNYLDYIGVSNINKIFETGKVKFTNHREYDQIIQPVSELLSVLDFYFSCTESMHDHSIYNLSSPLVQNLTYSGIYILKLSLPSTANYLPVSMDFEITVHTKIVDVFLTKAVRTYGEKEIVYDTANPKYITSIDEYRVMIDSTDGKIVEENGNIVYVYKEGGEIVEGNFVMYKGLLTEDYFGSDQTTDSLATVVVSLPTEKAGNYNNAISVANASKHNYAFNYYPITLYVLQKELSLEAEPVQTKTYTGGEIVPNHQIIGGVGELKLYKIGRVIDGVDVFDEVENENDATIVDVGTYIIKIYVIPMTGDEINYRVRDERLIIRLTVKEQEVVIVEQSKVAHKIYNIQNFSLYEFQYYFTGVESPAASSWGYVYISQAILGGVPVPQLTDSEGNLLYLLDSYNEELKDRFGNRIPIWDIRNSGIYTLSVTGIITNSSNTYFMDGEKVYALDFVISLEVEASSLLTLIVNTTEDVNKVETTAGYDANYTLIYNGLEAIFGYQLMALDQFDYSNGEIPVTITIDGVLYSYNNNIYSTTNPIYSANAALGIPNKIDGVTYSILHRNKLLNVGSYEITIYINTVGSENYNNNFATLEYTYLLEVMPASLQVFIDFEEGYGPYKVYGEKDSEIEKHIILRYSGWIGEEGEDEYILGEIVAPTIDWSAVGDDQVTGLYSICPVGGTAPSNYVFDYSHSNLNFYVLKADSWVRVYGFFDADKGIYTDYNKFTGLVQQPKILRMAGNTPIDTTVEVVSSEKINIVLEGLFIGNNKNRILPKDIDTSVKTCFDTGKYVFSVAVGSSTNYEAVPKAYYYFEIVKAELEMVFVVKEKVGENYSVTEVRGYSSKVYDGDDTSYPSFTIQYKGFVGADEKAVYKNVMEVVRVGEIVYVIVGENTFQTFARNFEYVQDGLGKYIRDSQGNYIMLNTKGNYIKDINGNFIPVTSIKGSYYLDGQDYKIINGTYIKDSSSNYLLGSSIVGSHILDENNDYVPIGDIQGTHATDILGNYYRITDTYMLTEDNSYVNILNLVGVYYKDESGSFVKPHEAVAQYFKDYSGVYTPIISLLGNYNKDENDNFVLVEEGTGEYVRNEKGDYILLTVVKAGGSHVKNYDGEYLDIIGLMGEYVKDRLGRYFRLSELVICPYVPNGSGGYVYVNYLINASNDLMLFFKDSLGNYVNCEEVIATHIIDENENFVKVRTYLGNIVSFNMPYVRTTSGDYVNFDTLKPDYVRSISGDYIAINSVVAEYIRNSAGDYLKVADILEQSIVDENGDTVVVTANSAKYFCDESGNYVALGDVTASYVKLYDDQFIRVVGEYVRLESFDYVKVDNLVYNYIKDSLGNYIKVRDEVGNILTGVMGNYVVDGDVYVLAEGAGTHILDENGIYLRVNGNYVLNNYGVAGDNDALGLTHPVYEIFDEYGAIAPTDVDTYKIRIAQGEFFGLAKNYNISVGYKQNGEQIAYPELEITKRPIDITYSNNMVTKVYDSYSRIPQGSVTSANYVFLKTRNEYGEVENSGLIEGDVVGLRFNASLSAFMRSTVLDSNGQDTQNYVKIYGFSIDNSNYVLQPSGLITDEYGKYLQLLARINPASATIRFVDKNGKNITNRLEVVYNAESHPVSAIVQGVRFDEGTYEVINYSINYFCERNNYDSQDAPKNAESYIVTLSIEDSNYVSTKKIVDLLIAKAETSIVFGGDTVQTYGSVTSALVAEARGVGGYSQTLEVLYYNLEGKHCADITVANSDIYKARAIHYESTNFKQKIVEEDFVINRLDVSLYYDLSPAYAYTGRAVAPKIHFKYNGITYEPKLKFNASTLRGSNNFVPYNYGGATNATYPKDVGDYQLQALNDMQNFNIVDTFWTNFSIVPVDLVVSIADLTVLTDSSISFNYMLQGQVNGESITQIFTKMPLVQYYSASNQKLGDAPTVAGLYKVEPYGGEAPNYNVSYRFGMLSINNSRLLAGSSSEEELAVVEGSFAANVDLSIREITNTNFSSYTTSFDAFKVANPEYAIYHIIKIYYLSLSDGSVSASGSGELFIRLYVPELFDKATVEASSASYNSIKKADDGSYYVAHINSQGEINMIQAYREGDYLCFNSNSLEVYCILSTTELKEAKNDDWILYVSISFGVVLVAIALIIVRKRA